MKKIFTLFILLCAFSSCTEISITEETVLLTDEVKYYATITESDPASRTYLDEQRRQCWDAKDSISVFRTTRNERFNFDGVTGDFEGSFTRDASESADTSVGDAISTTYALYPCDASATLDAEEEKISLTMPAMQYYAKNSYGPSANVMVAAAESAQSNLLPFRSVGGYLVVKLYGENTTIASITLAGNNGEVLAGNATVEARYGYTPSLMMAEGGSREVTIDCGAGVTLSNDKENPTEFWFVLPPVTFEKGITIMTVNSQNQMDTQSSNKKLTVSRNTAKLMAAYKPMFNGPANNELWYKSKFPGTEKVDIYVSGFETPVFGYNADGTKSIFEYDYNPGRCYRVKHFSGEVTQLPVYIFYDKDKLEEVALPNSLRKIYQHAFSGCDGLKGIIIPENVYQIDQYAFLGCSSLETVLIKGQLTSLGGMIFYDCTSLKIVEFAEGITKLTDRMFGNCVSLETITLPASIKRIDAQIFEGCTNLKTVYVKATTPPEMSYWVFADNEHNNLNCKIYVPVESVEEYKKASNWSTYADQIEGYNF